MMEVVAALILGSVTVMVGSIVLYVIFESLGFVRPGLKSPTIRIMKLAKLAPDYELHGTSITFSAPTTVLLRHEGGRDVIDTGYYVAIPDGYCGVVVVRTEHYRDSNDRTHTNIGTGRTFLPPGFMGQVQVEVWNKDEFEPAGLKAGMPLADLHLVVIPSTIRILDSI